MSDTKYYRSLLNELERKVYDVYLEGLENQESVITLPVFDPDSIQRILYAINFDNPQLFYVDFSKGSLIHSREKCVINVNYYHTGEELEVIKQKIRKAASNIIRGIQGGTPEETALYLHDRLVRRCSYETLSERPQDAHNLIGPLLDYRCVCEGYAKAYKYLSDFVELPCIVVCGEGIHPDGSTAGHAWNLIRVKKNNYHVDVTFDLLIGQKYCSRAYYGLSTKEILYDHTIDPIFKIPDCPVSSPVLKKVSGTRELIQFLKEEVHHGKSFSEVRLSKSFTGETLMNMIEKRLTPEDLNWYRHLDAFWYKDAGKTVSVCWK